MSRPKNLPKSIVIKTHDGTSFESVVEVFVLSNGDCIKIDTTNWNDGTPSDVALVYAESNDMYLDKPEAALEAAAVMKFFAKLCKKRDLAQAVLDSQETK